MVVHADGRPNIPSSPAEVTSHGVGLGKVLLNLWIRNSRVQKLFND
jgi:hypothetical protein